VSLVQYTFTNKQYTEYKERNIYNNKKKKNWEVRDVPRLCELYLGICLTTEEKARKKIRVFEKCPDIPVAVAVLLYYLHLLNPVSMCCITLSTSPSECCIHVLCYFMQVMLWLLYPCAVLLFPRKHLNVVSICNVPLSTSPDCCIHVLCYLNHVAIWMLYPYAMVLYPNHLTVVSVCYVTLSKLPDCCIHVLCYCIHVTFWLLYPCAVLPYPRYLLNAVSMCCYFIHVTFWLLYPCVVLFYPRHLTAVYMCCATVSTSPSDCCIHGLCYFIHVTFWMLYPCAVTSYTSRSGCCIHVLCYFIYVTIWMLYPNAVLLYPHHLLVVCMCYVSLTISPSECCIHTLVTFSTSPDCFIHVLCYFIYVTWLLYPHAMLLDPCHLLNALSMCYVTVSTYRLLTAVPTCYVTVSKIHLLTAVSMCYVTVSTNHLLTAVFMYYVTVSTLHLLTAVSMCYVIVSTRHLLTAVSMCLVTVSTRHFLTAVSMIYITVSTPHTKHIIYIFLHVSHLFCFLKCSNNVKTISVQNMHNFFHSIHWISPVAKVSWPPLADEQNPEPALKGLWSNLCSGTLSLSRSFYLDITELPHGKATGDCAASAVQSAPTWLTASTVRFNSGELCNVQSSNCMKNVQIKPVWGISEVKE
jgi:hypothetical protein